MNYRHDSLCGLLSLSLVRNKNITFRENTSALSLDLRIRSTATQLDSVAATFSKFANVMSLRLAVYSCLISGRMCTM